MKKRTMDEWGQWEIENLEAGHSLSYIIFPPTILIHIVPEHICVTHLLVPYTIHVYCIPVYICVCSDFFTMK